MTEEMDKKLAEMIRNYKKDEIEEINRKAQETVAKTRKACEEAAKIKPNFDFSELNKSMAKVRQNKAQFEKTQANVKKVCDDLVSGKIKVEIDTEAIQRSVKTAKEATVNANRICENLRQKTGDC